MSGRRASGARRVAGWGLTLIVAAGCAVPIGDPEASAVRDDPTATPPQESPLPSPSASSGHAGGTAPDPIAWEWEELPAGPLSPRGGAEVVWTGSEVLLIGGWVHRGEEPPCDPGEMGVCLLEEPERLRDGASYNPSARTWSVLPALPSHLPVPWPVHATDDGFIGLGTRFADGAWVDINRGTLPLVYDPPLWSGQELLAFGWDWGQPGDGGGTGQVTVSELDPDTDETWRSTPWPHDPPGLESITSVWTGEEAIAFVWRDCEDGTTCTAMVGWDPAHDAWREIAMLPTDTVRSPGWDGRRIIAYGDDGGLQRIDPITGAVTALPSPPEGFMGLDPIVRPGAVALVEADQVAVFDLLTGRWSVPPPVPFEVPGDGRVTVWAGEDLLVWGGARDPSFADTQDTADGYLLRRYDGPPA